MGVLLAFGVHLLVCSSVNTVVLLGDHLLLCFGRHACLSRAYAAYVCASPVLFCTWSSCSACLSLPGAGEYSVK